MLNVIETVTIRAPRERVFAAAVDPMEQLKWDAGTLTRVEQLTVGPVVVGARYRGHFKGMGALEYEFVEHDPPRRFAHRAATKLGEVRHSFGFEATPEGTRVTQALEVRPTGVGKAVAPLLARLLRRRARQLNAELAAYLASPPP